MTKALDLIGKKFGHLTVKKRIENDKKNSACWLCVCSCGKKTKTNSNSLTSGKVKSCGCSHGLTKKEYIKKHIKINDNGCWIWIGNCVDKDGYGRFRYESKDLRAHRVSYEEYNGKIPVGLLACHICDIPSCCNPDHLFLGTPDDNSKDMVTKGRAFKKKEKMG